MKKKKQKKKLHGEEKFVKMGTRVLMLITIVFCIILGTIKTFSGDEDGNNYLTADFTSLYEVCDTREIITIPVSDDYRAGMVEKINTANLDILSDNPSTENMPSYEKFSQDNISITSNISFTSQEVALLYSYVYMFNPDAYDTILQQFIINKSDNGVVTIDIVSSISFYDLFTKKVKGQYESNAISQLPKRIYAINSFTLDNGTCIYSDVKYNNMSVEKSKEVSQLINTATPDINMNNYIPNLVVNFLNELSTKSNTTLTYINDGITLSINN